MMYREETVTKGEIKIRECAKIKERIKNYIREALFLIVKYTSN